MLPAFARPALDVYSHTSPRTAISQQPPCTPYGNPADCAELSDGRISDRWRFLLARFLLYPCFRIPASEEKGEYPTA
jgi:hypothetical protein